MREDVKKKTRSGGSLLAAGAIVVSLASGCVTLPEGPPTIQGIEYDDMPVPDQFEYVSTESAYLDVMEEGQFRSWRGTYKGGGKYSDLVPWYLESMRTHGWIFKDLQGADDDRRMRFEKGEEMAEIRIYRRVDAAAGTFLNYVEAEIHPRGVEDEPIEDAIANLRSDGSRARTAGYARPHGELAPPSLDTAPAEIEDPGESTNAGAQPGTNGKTATPPAAGSDKIKIRIIDTPSTRRATSRSAGVERYEREIQSAEQR